MAHRSIGRVYRLKFSPPAQLDFFASPEDQLVRVLYPGNRTTRYNRTWIVGQTHVEDGILIGRLGFQGDGTTDWWDDDKKDFIEIAIPAGTTAPFAINLETLEAAMQPRSGQIKIRGLIGAFSALLADAGFRWKIVGLNQHVSLEQWKASVTKVVAVTFLIKEPNPHYGDRKNLEDLMKELETEAIRLEAVNESTGVNLDSEFIKQTEDHIERGYGDAEYKGIKPGGAVSSYTTNVGTEEDSEEVPVNAETGEVSTALLQAMVTAEIPDDRPSLLPSEPPAAPPDWLGQQISKEDNGEGGNFNDPFSHN